MDNRGCGLAQDGVSSIAVFESIDVCILNTTYRFTRSKLNNSPPPGEVGSGEKVSLKMWAVYGDRSGPHPVAGRVVHFLPNTTDFAWPSK